MKSKIVLTADVWIEKKVSLLIKEVQKFMQIHKN